MYFKIVKKKTSVKNKICNKLTNRVFVDNFIAFWENIYSTFAKDLKLSFAIALID
jgi:hypothetical protein